MRRMVAVPFNKPRCYEAAPFDITLSSRLNDTSLNQSNTASEEHSHAHSTRFEKIAKALSAPITIMSQFSWQLLSALARVWTRDGFIKVQVKGLTGVLKMDEVGGWALENGKGVNRLIRVKPVS